MTYMASKQGLARTALGIEHFSEDAICEQDVFKAVIRFAAHEATKLKGARDRQSEFTVWQRDARNWFFSPLYSKDRELVFDLAGKSGKLQKYVRRIQFMIDNGIEVTAKKQPFDKPVRQKNAFSPHS